MRILKSLLLAILIQLELFSAPSSSAQTRSVVDAENQELVAVSEEDISQVPPVQLPQTKIATESSSTTSLSTTNPNEAIDIGGGIKIKGARVYFPPLPRDRIDYLFDKLRSGGVYTPQPIRRSQDVPANVSGIWAGVRSSLESKIPSIVLRFRPTHEARLQRARPGVRLVPLAEYFDIELRWRTDVEFTIRHQFAEDRRAQIGLSVKVGEVTPNQVMTEFVRGYRDAGVYLSWPQSIVESIKPGWSLFICPRTPKIVQAKVTEQPKLFLQPSSYELSEVNFSISGLAQARMAPTDRAERIDISLFSSETLPQALRNSDSAESLYPRLEVPYVAGSNFDFFNFPLIEGSLQTGLLARIVNRNPARHVRRQYHSHVVSIQRLNEPSPVSVYINEYKAAKDEGLCYVVSEQRAVWNEYDREDES
jgi:hypothetical protein